MGVFVLFRFEDGKPVVLPGAYASENEAVGVRKAGEHIGCIQKVIGINSDGTMANDEKDIQASPDGLLFGCVSWYMQKFPALWIFAVSTKEEAERWLERDILVYSAINGERGHVVEIAGVRSVPFHGVDDYNDIMFGPLR
jgi:hypothetical protein